MVSLFAFIESNVEINCGFSIYRHDVISGTNCKTTITPHIVPYKSRSLICSQCLLRRHWLQIQSMPPKEALIADQWSIVRFAMPLSTSVIVSEVCQSGGMQAWREVSNHFREPLWEVSNHFREPLERSLDWILKTSLSPKDQKELFVPFSNNWYCPVVRAKLDITLWSGLCVIYNPVVSFDLRC